MILKHLSVKGSENGSRSCYPHRIRKEVPYGNVCDFEPLFT